ncbi:MAG: garR1 [Herminiimonas sp.]|nr:garR1 [Herminiimonas sp.]
MSSTRQFEAHCTSGKASRLKRPVYRCAVSGRVAGAEAGTPAIMTRAVLPIAHAEPILNIMGLTTLVGPAARWRIAELCNRLLVGGTLNTIAEALLLAQSGGADRAWRPNEKPTKRLGEVLIVAAAAGAVTERCLVSSMLWKMPTFGHHARA